MAAIDMSKFLLITDICFSEEMFATTVKNKI